LKYNFDQIINRYNTNCAKYDCAKYLYQGIPDDVIPMWVADMDFAVPPEVLAAMHDRIDQGILGYTYVMDPGYSASIMRWMKDRFQWDISNCTILPTGNVVDTLHHIVSLLTEPGDGVIVQPPVYPQFFNAVRGEGRTLVYNHLLSENGYYRIDFDDLEQKARKKSNTLLILCSPHNPTGRVWTREELLRVGEICLKNDVRIVCDEVHHDLIRQSQKHIPIASLFPTEKNIYTCTAPSKTFNVAGNNLSNLITADDSLLPRWSQAFHDSISPIAVAATQAAYSLCDAWVNELCEYLDESFLYMNQFFQEHLPKTRFQIPEGTYLAWIDFSAYESNPKLLYQKICQQAGVILEKGSKYDPDNLDSTKYLRMNIACPRSILKDALERIASVLNN